MNKSNVMDKQSMLRILLIAFAAAVVVALIIALTRPALADSGIVVPPVPDGIGVLATEGKVFLEGHATGTQNYICLPTATGFAYSLFTPEATLFGEDGGQIITHYFAPNPADRSSILAVWQHKDTSTIFAMAVASSTDSNFVATGAIPWVKLQVKNHTDGPNGGDKLSGTTFVQRLNTHGGSAPSTGCASLSDVGHKAFVGYTADYFFYQ